jgi:hypothetical protein
MDNQAKIANCKICTLAQKMKDCPKCAFNIGLQNVTAVTKSPKSPNK